jgi:hypothetical protein
MKEGRVSVGDVLAPNLPGHDEHSCLVLAVGEGYVFCLSRGATTREFWGDAALDRAWWANHYWRFL